MRRTVDAIGPLAVAFATWLLAAAGPTLGAEKSGRISLLLRPLVEDGVIEAIRIETVIAGALQDEPPTLAIYGEFGPLKRIGARVSALSAADARGPIALASETVEIATTPFPISERRWRLARAPQDELSYAYTVVVSRETATGPVWELRSEPKGASAMGAGFLVLPIGTDPYTVEITWDLSALPDGAQALTSFPPSGGRRPEPLDRLRRTFFMAGLLTTWPEDLEKAGAFRAASTAEGAIDQKALLAWSKRTYDAFLDFFDAPSEPPFTIFVRENPFGGSGGGAAPEALMSTMSRDTSLEEMDFLIAHEIAHVFLAGLADAGSWFNEGLAVHYQRRVPFMAGLIGPEQFIADVNDTARRYYANVRNRLPMEEAEALFWSDARGRILPYDRGAFYFASVDAKLKAATDGARGLDDVLREMLVRKRQGERMDVETYLAILERDLGEAARTDHAAMMSGAMIVPPSDAFGACFRRTAFDAPAFELGFDIASLMTPPRVIKGLDPDSPAARAGLREGDVVINPMVLDAVQGEPSKLLTLKIDRGGEIAEIAFRPEGAARRSYRWVRDAGVPDSACRR
ncbi:hypothetical protein [Amphiplicatus metriothermophilus]|uniref:Predicted metalloprotease, contains C-terminal PDZ domain n=1 Tax=Amphiplicatus metriothermophilus TaxID=1519374 RepID=A0A239PVD3_9PROT|nr:hypothetical protein [Amphiplicatus metriothermophilus]MBB5519566.1 putative metalloprotease with PDZ domain [Amphiplicatus metriothermophilus]SNT74130.1 Predicted metalloprotease, contains C-terminal PDZ domain [Amphiplicatus metriothermophilus]